MNQVVELNAEAAGIQIPSGEPVVLPEGTRVTVTQMLGSSVTLATDLGLVRLSRPIAENLGLLEVKEEAEGLHEGASLEERVWYELALVYDPEIPVDIVNLGLIYDVEIIMLENDLAHVNIKMTLTAPGCGMGPMIMEDARLRVSALPEVEAVDIDFVWEPAWNQEMMTEEGKMKLGLI